MFPTIKQITWRKGAQVKRVVALAVAASFAVAGLQALSLTTDSMVPATAATTPAYLDTSLAPEVRAADLVSRMTLDEKSQQLNAQTQTSQPSASGGGSAPAIPRLGIMRYGWWNEALHGIARSGSVTMNDGGRATSFPTGLGIASSWNRNLVWQIANATSDEARAFSNWTNPGSVAIEHKGLSYWSPTINMHRDPRWGRAEETYGEDPFLTGETGAQFTTGMQGDVAANGGYLKTIVTPKHYLANNAETNRHIGSANLTDSELREYYTPAFAKLTGEYGAKSFMTSYNRVNGVPVSASRFLVETLARRTWGFNGVVTSDCDAIRDAWNSSMHQWMPEGEPLTNQSGVAYTLKAGTELDCMDNDYGVANGLRGSVAQGHMSESDIDVALVRAFAIRFQFGEFDTDLHNDPYGATPWADFSLRENVDTPYHQAIAKQAAAEATVLLKNQGNILPLPKPANSSKYVVVGPMASLVVNGDYSPTSIRDNSYSAAVAVTDYIKDRAPNADVKYITGRTTTVASDLNKRKPPVGNSSKAIRFLDATGNELGSVATDTIIRSGNYEGWRGPQPWSASTAQMATIGATDGFFGVDVNIPAGTKSITVEVALGGTGNTGTVDPTNGSNTCYAIGTNLLPGSFNLYLGGRSFENAQKLGKAEAVPDNPLGTCVPNTLTATQARARSAPVTFVTPGQIDRLAGTQRTLYFEWESDYFAPVLTAADKLAISNADYVIAYAGTTAMQSMCLTNPETPSEMCTGATIASDSSEDEDRATLDLPRQQGELIKEVAKLNSNVISWTQAVSQVNVEPFLNNVPAVIWTSYNGQYQGRNIPDIIFGDADPSGRLPFTWYTDLNQLPPTKDYTMTATNGLSGRTYQYFNGDVTYPFGYGLSYSSFALSNLRLSSSAVDVNGNLTATVNVKNTSNRAGKTVVQAYLSSPKASDPLRPNLQLKGYDKVSLNPGQAKDVAIAIPAKDLWFWDTANQREVFDLGKWTIYVGQSADVDTALTSTFTLAGQQVKGVDVVAALPDGVVLNTEAPGNVIHANLSATRTDQSFYDLSKVQVAYTSSNPAVAAVDSRGRVSPVGAGWATITATVTADGTTKSTSFPVVVHTGQLDVTGTCAVNGANCNTNTTLFANVVTFADLDITVAAAGTGVALTGGLVPDAVGANYTYRMATAEENSAGGAVTTGGLFTAQRAGTSRVTVTATYSGKSVSRTATIYVGTVDTSAVVDKGDLINAVAAGNAFLADLDQAAYTTSSVAPIRAAITAAQTAVGNAAATQAQVNAATDAVYTAIAAITPVGDTTALEAAIALAKGLAPLASGYSQTTWNALVQAVTAAERFLVDISNATQATVDARTAAINAAVNALVPPTVTPPPASTANADALRAKVAALTTATSQSSAYTSGSWTAFQAALASANAVLAGNPVSETAAASNATALDNAFRGLVLRPVTGSLEAAVTAALAVPTGVFTEASQAVLNAAVGAAQGLLTQSLDVITQAAINTALADIQNALGQLAPIPPEPQPTPTIVVNPPEVVVNPPDVVVNPPDVVVNPPRVVVTVPPAPSQPAPATNQPAPSTPAATQAAVDTAQTPNADQKPNSVTFAVAIKAAQKSVTLVKGKSFKLKANGYTAQGTAAKVTWKSSNSKVAKVSATGKVKAKKTGKATIKATYAGLTTKIKVKVVAKKPTAKVKKVTVTGPTSLKVGQAGFITATYSSTKAASVKVTYKSSNPAVATIDKNGRIIAKAAGTTVITVKAGKKTTKVSLTVS